MLKLSEHFLDACQCHLGRHCLSSPYGELKYVYRRALRVVLNWVGLLGLLGYSPENILQPNIDALKQ